MTCRGLGALAGEPRVIASEIAGTTRDSIDVRFDIDGHTFVAIDTAGVRKARRARLGEARAGAGAEQLGTRGRRLAGSAEGRWGAWRLLGGAQGTLGLPGGSQGVNKWVAKGLPRGGQGVAKG